METNVVGGNSIRGRQIHRESERGSVGDQIAERQVR